MCAEVTRSGLGMVHFMSVWWVFLEEINVHTDKLEEVRYAHTGTMVPFLWGALIKPEEKEIHLFLGVKLALHS